MSAIEKKMYKNELDNHIKNSTTPRAIMLFGENHYYIDQYTEILSNKPNCALLRLYYDEYDITKAKNHLSQGSLFGDINVLVVKTDKRIPKSELDIIIELVNKNSDNYFIYSNYDEDLKFLDMHFKGNNTATVRFFYPNIGEAKSVVANEAKKLGIQIDENAIIELINIEQNNLSLAVNELSKLAILDKHIGIKEIHTHIDSLSEVRFDEFISCVLEKKDFMPHLRQMLDLGVNKTLILSALTQYITQLYLFKTSIKLNASADPIKILGYKAPGFVVDKKMKQCVKINSKNYQKAINHLLDTDLKMKSVGSPDAESLLFASILKVQSII